MSTLSALPIPDYCQVEHYYGVTAYWFASNFTQSRYPNNQECKCAAEARRDKIASSRGRLSTASQACTLICLLVSSGVAQAKLHIGPESYNDLLTQVIAESIISGNRAYDRIMCRRLVKHHHLSVTDALKYCCPELCHMREWVHAQVLSFCTSFTLIYLPDPPFRNGTSITTISRNSWSST
ncbi:unnamed protein product [Trichogramma brassicae]|uniref:Uncharacterized protein n=1 Tax=Trichogramma brassicae TaxID=86971 RepID=A0A6H5I346_9HYME|nr:unnamed protein product [Trichogramma brassicae]